MNLQQIVFIPWRYYSIFQFLLGPSFIIFDNEEVHEEAEQPQYIRVRMYVNMKLPKIDYEVADKLAAFQEWEQRLAKPLEGPMVHVCYLTD